MSVNIRFIFIIHQERDNDTLNRTKYTSTLKIKEIFEHPLYSRHCFLVLFYQQLKWYRLSTYLMLNCPVSPLK